MDVDRSKARLHPIVAKPRNKIIHGSIHQPRRPNSNIQFPTCNPKQDLNLSKSMQSQVSHDHMCMNTNTFNYISMRRR